jgi:hypothetical protein
VAPCFQTRPPTCLHGVVPKKSGVEEIGKGLPEEEYAFPLRPCHFPRALRTVSVHWHWQQALAGLVGTAWRFRSSNGSELHFQGFFKIENLECLYAGSKLPLL